MNEIPCLLYEDEHLLVVNKPAGINTHAPSPFMGEGIYDWLRHREPRWASLAIVHRLDKETSGVLLFTRSPLANRSLTRQFAERTLRKTYLLLTDRPVAQNAFTVESALVRAGDRYVGRPVSAGRESAVTRFRVAHSEAGSTLLEAEPVTGRTHQIRVHAAAQGLPILGDQLYDGTPAARVFLHASNLVVKHPASDKEITFCAPATFQADPRLALRESLIECTTTTAFRLLHGATDGWPGWFVDRLGDFLLSQSDHPLSADQQTLLEHLRSAFSLRGAYHKVLRHNAYPSDLHQASPVPAMGDVAPAQFEALENDLRFNLSFNEGYSIGLFLDQRDNRRRFLVNHIAADFPVFSAQPGEVLNAFAYTCGFSVCAAKAGALVTSIDLSRKYLEWGRRNFTLNALDHDRHAFIQGDVFDWLPRLARKQRQFDVVILDPPTFSQSKVRGAFRVQKDYVDLVRAVLPLLKSGGVLFASTNASKFRAEEFLASITNPISSAHRQIIAQHYVPQPPDFPICRSEPAYLKTVWLRVA